ncbi:GntR family transcriptional regulator [Blastococcus sp. Marseille-P5729]|uniref:GntR family transcriptional regulator n=1 Tax=Blastococcus sp. Marseille-P5729 TaxID=2086582 RepID=UPI000D11361A|nr:GntR family transcriptional regulator [Blastococcus sp. Marseille-P5729]
MTIRAAETAFVLDTTAQLSPQIAVWLRDRIISGHFAPQDKLKPEHIAEMCGASATPVREALMTLHGEGLVSFAPGRGFTVRPLTRQDIEDLMSAHAHFAALLTERAARALSDADVQKLREIQAAIGDAAGREDFDEVERLDDEFHRIINRSTGSDRLKWLYRTTMRFIPHRLFDQIEGFKEAAVEDHVVIIKGLINRNPEAAAAAMRAHWLNVATMLIRHMRTHGALADG